MDRRPIRSRDTRWAHACARWLCARGATPNGISLAGLGCAALAALCLAGAFRVGPAAGAALLLLAALALPARLLCNLFDGMVAIEGGRAGKAGDVYNDLPDRISDALVLVGTGYGLSAWPWAAELGWAAALAAVFTAYVRVLGGACGLTQRFTGPLAKSQRMAVLSVAALVAAGARAADAGWAQGVLALALAVILLGSVATVVRRSVDLVRELEAR
ncbi:phosphatidylglycerophosphate synthase [Plasticicumulans lactativorans]|uniref:Phosphatidylglycerophosphate synthase n=1 Tax=Plasticicumulans lactativorans TaxID=1133106 RepID=A0A4R2LC67_9GAMM|nr:CDP-alcohol phosphatidyltransferase family protein [Plasticicumulans lactativorans]TCO81942.1 phosphatidylglycerophosphate synthase [Plasticicumulans lactativorans]